MQNKTKETLTKTVAFVIYSRILTIKIVSLIKGMKGLAYSWFVAIFSYLNDKNLDMSRLEVFKEQKRARLLQNDVAKGQK